MVPRFPPCIWIAVRRCYSPFCDDRDGAVVESAVFGNLNCIACAAHENVIAVCFGLVHAPIVARGGSGRLLANQRRKLDSQDTGEPPQNRDVRVAALEKLAYRLPRHVRLIPIAFPSRCWVQPSACFCSQRVRTFAIAGLPVSANPNRTRTLPTRTRTPARTRYSARPERPSTSRIE
jgi:hypothetical protein